MEDIPHAESSPDLHNTQNVCLILKYILWSMMMLIVSKSALLSDCKQARLLLLWTELSTVYKSPGVSFLFPHEQPSASHVSFPRVCLVVARRPDKVQACTTLKMPTPFLHHTLSTYYLQQAKPWRYKTERMWRHVL